MEFMIGDPSIHPLKNGRTQGKFMNYENVTEFPGLTHKIIFLSAS